MNIQTLKGFRDFLPNEARKRQLVLDILKKVFESYGFEPLETPALEYEEILTGKYGDEGDKLMYKFEDNGGRKVALRYDQTVPLARVVAQYAPRGDAGQNELPMPFKRYQIQNVWRAENTQKGRYREFLQVDADIVGSSSPLSDAEIIACIAKCLDELGFKKYKVLINDREIFSGLDPKVIREIDKLKKIGREKVAEGAGSEVLKKIEQAKPTQDIENVFMALKVFGVEPQKLEFSPTLARGLDYYTGMIFEVEVEGYEFSIAGGGRYDNLIGVFAGKQIPAVGGSFGFDRLMEAMDELKFFPSELNTTKVLVTVFNPSLLKKSQEVTMILRRIRVNTEVYLNDNASLEKQLKYADKKGIPYAIIIGPNEVKNETVMLKDLKNKTQKEVKVENLTSKLKDL